MGANQAVLSIPISKKAGETRRAFNNFNLNNLPDPKHNDPAKDDKDAKPILGPINVLDISLMISKKLLITPLSIGIDTSDQLPNLHVLKTQCGLLLILKFN